jgi:peptidoglycan biosynthesis protein MviN/MurJ (putative lipid II flippase)
MSTDTAWALIASGAALAVIGMAMLWVSAARGKRRRVRSAQPFVGLAGALICTSVVCGVITGVQWAVLSQAGPGAAWAAVLWLPAFLAAATVARLFAVMRIVHGRRRQASAVRRGRRRDR